MRSATIVRAWDGIEGGRATIAVPRPERPATQGSITIRVFPARLPARPGEVL